MTDHLVCRISGERARLYSFPRGEVLVDIRYGEGVTKLSDLDHVQARGEIEIVVLDSIERVVEQLRVPHSTLSDGDALIIFVANEEIYAAAVSTLCLPG